MPIDFPAPLANAIDYPQPSILATASRANWQFFAAKQDSQSQFLQQLNFTKNGRAAIAVSALRLGLKPGDAILLPEYFCPAMVEPFLWLGLTIKFYPLNENLEVQQDAFKGLIDEQVKACLFVRFFGFALDIEASLLMAKSLGLLVIEDCAHSFFSPQTNVQGLSFDASICSLNKFFPCYDGGMYRLNTTSSVVDAPIQSQRKLGQESKMLLHYLGADKFVSALSSAIKKNGKSQATEVVQLEQEYRYFCQQDINQPCFILTEWLIKYAALNAIKQARRDNYQTLYQALLSSSIGKPLFALAPDTVPYVLPFVLNDKNDFHHIRQQGIQILRWEEYYPSSNTVIESYRQRLVQIPCHQSLSLQDLTKIIQVFNPESRYA